MEMLLLQEYINIRIEHKYKKYHDAFEAFDTLCSRLILLREEGCETHKQQPVNIYDTDITEHLSKVKNLKLKYSDRINMYTNSS